MWRKKYFRYSLMAVILVLVIWLWRSSGWQQILSQVNSYTREPLDQGYKIGTLLVNGNEAVINNEALEATAQAELERLRLENEKLRKELLLSPNKDYITVGAQIIGRRSDETGVTFLLDRGQQDAVHNGSAVIVSGVLVGMIVKTEIKDSEMILINSPLFNTTAEVLNDFSSRGLLEGEYNLAMNLKMLPADDEIKVGQMVITSGLDEFIPRGLLLGSVASVGKKEGELFQQAVVISPLNLGKLGILHIIIK